MIVKSMARKTASFGQLIDYMNSNKADETYHLYQNLYHHRLEDIQAEFETNAQLIQKRKNGNILYHEILSITKAQSLSDTEQKTLLKDIASRYAQHRAEHSLVFGTLHDDHTHHLHYHLLISANAVGESKKTRLSKAQFNRVKEDLEQRVLKHHPELEQKVVMTQQAQEKLSQKGAELHRRTGKTPERDRVKTQLQEIFNRCHSKTELFEALNEASLQFYARGNMLGVTDTATNRKHRLKTLGLLDEFQTLSNRIELDEVQKKPAEKASQSSTEPPGTDKDSTHTEHTEEHRSHDESSSAELKQEAQYQKHRAEMKHFREKQPTRDISHQHPQR